MKKKIILSLFLLLIFGCKNITFKKEIIDENKNILKAYVKTYYKKDGIYFKINIRSRYEKQLEIQNFFYEPDDNRNFLFENIKLKLRENLKKQNIKIDAYIDKTCDIKKVDFSSLPTLNVKHKKNEVAINLNMKNSVPIINAWDFDSREMCFFIKNSEEVLLEKNIKNIKFNIKNLGKNSEKIEVINSFVDLSEFKYFDKISRSKENFLKENPIFKSLEKNKVSLSGEYKITETIIIPNTVELIIQPGTKLIMSEGVSIVSYGKVIAKGTSDKQIMVKAENPQKPFGVFALANEGASGSEFKNFHIEHGSETKINGIYFSGMFSAYHNNDIIIEDSYFGYSHSDDGLNSKYSNSKVINSVFEKNSADAIDFDFMSGEIRGNKFIENGNDSIDTSGSTTLIHDNYIYKSGDKCMSFGEKTKTVVFNNILDSCLIGVECKDSTTSILLNNAIINNEMAVNSYQKKDFFGSAHCEIYNTIFANNKQGITFQNNFKEGKKLKTDKSTITIKDSILPDKKYKNDNIIEKFDSEIFFDKRKANLEKLKEFYPEYLGDSVNFGIFDLDKIPQIK